ncbi:MAG: Ku protein [Thermoanaerobaculia bacterium]
MAEEDEVPQGGGGPRPFWSGTITFGLVSIPVALFPANRSNRVGLRMVAPDGTPLERRYVCSEEEKELDWDEIVRGYEVEKGKFVVVTDDELEALEPAKSREIDLQLFVERDAIDPKFFERAYFLTPAAGSNKAYRLLADVMEDTGQAGIATFVMRTKEYVVAILAENGILHAETLRFEDELRTPKDVGLPKPAKPKPADVRAIEQEIEKKEKKVDFSEFLDDYAERLEKLVAKKQRAGEGIVKRKETKEAAEEAEVIDLLEVLRRSMKEPEGRRAPRKAARKGASKSKKRARK